MMNNNNSISLFRPTIIISLCLFVASAALLFPATKLSQKAAMLPVFMLVSMMVLTVILAIQELRKARTGKAPSKSKINSPNRVVGAMVSIFLFMLSADYLGFYLSTAVFLPACAYCFGCRNVKVLIAADVIVVAVIYVVFSLAMSKGFPTGSIW